MKLSLNMMIQAVLTTMQIANALTDALPSIKAKTIAAGVAAALQGALTVLAAFRNPDGSPASQPYKK